MALADYYLCDICGNKTFYDAVLNYDDDDFNGERYLPPGAGDIRVICTACADEGYMCAVVKTDD